VTAGVVELAQILAVWAVAIPMVFAVVLADERRLRGTALARAWPPVSRDAAVFAMWMFGFHPVYVLAFFLVHFGRTRASARGLLLGLGWAALTVTAQILAALGVLALAGALDG
jgi:hypothetical protein